MDCEEGHVLSLVHVRQNLQCRMPVEVPYYSAKYTPICYQCGRTEDLSKDEQYYPVCAQCIGCAKERVKRCARQVPAKK